MASGSPPPVLLGNRSAYRWMGPDQARFSPAGDGQGLIGCGFSVKPPGEDGRQRLGGHWSAVLCLRGEATYRDHRGVDHPIVPGRLFQRFSDLPHGLRLGPRWAECWIAFGVPLERALLAHGVISHGRPVITVGIDPGLLGELARQRDSLGSAAEDALPHHLIRLQGLLLSFLAGANREDGGDLDVERACRLLGEDPRADLAAVARELGLGYERFRKRFRQLTGVSPGAWRLRRRLDRARTLLMTGGQSIHEIARDLGYGDPFAFTAQFRAHLGCPPSEFRRRHRGG